MNRQLMIDRLVSTFEKSLDDYDIDLVNDYLGELNDKTEAQLIKEFQIECNPHEHNRSVGFTDPFLIP